MGRSGGGTPQELLLNYHVIKGDLLGRDLVTYSHWGIYVYIPEYPHHLQN